MGVDLGKVFEDLPPEDFLTTGGGPDESGRVVFAWSDEEGEGCLVGPWKPLLGDGTVGVEPVFEDCEDLGGADLGEVLRLGLGALGESAALVLEAEPDVAALEDCAKFGAELEVSGPDLGGRVEPEEALCSTEEDDTLLLLPPLAVACRILLFSSLIILSLSSLHCLSLACLSFSYTSNSPVATRMERPGASRAKSDSGRGRSSTGLTPHRAQASRE